MSAILYRNWKGEKLLTVGCAGDTGAGKVGLAHIESTGGHSDCCEGGGSSASKGDDEGGEMHLDVGVAG